MEFYDLLSITSATEKRESGIGGKSITKFNCYGFLVIGLWVLGLTYSI
jgi:hypothetical protein